MSSGRRTARRGPGWRGGGRSWAAGGASGRRNLVRRCERGGRFRTWDVIIDAIVPALCEVRPPRVPVLMIRGSYRPTTPPPGPRLPLCDGGLEKRDLFRWECHLRQEWLVCWCSWNGNSSSHENKCRPLPSESFSTIVSNNDRTKR